jgi:catechol 2,3-dioxygenase-like lactoylglutathione lyase family enzyme
VEIEAPADVLPYDAPRAVTSLGYALQHIQLAIPPGTEDACRSFYVGLLGLHEVRKPPILAVRGGLWLRGDILELHLGVEQDFRPAKKAHPGILVSRIDHLADILEQAGILVDWDDTFPGYRRFYSVDPVGNRLEFMTPQNASDGS